MNPWASFFFGSVFLAFGGALLHHSAFSAWPVEGDLVLGVLATSVGGALILSALAAWRTRRRNFASAGAVVAAVAAKAAKAAPPSAPKRRLGRAMVGALVLGLLGWGASFAIADVNTHPMARWLSAPVQALRATVDAVVKLLPSHSTTPSEIEAVASGPDASDAPGAPPVTNAPLSQFDAATQTFSFQDKIGSTRANVAGRWRIEDDRLLVSLDRIDVDYASVGCKWTQCDSIRHLQFRLLNAAGERQSEDEVWDWRGTALEISPPIKLGQRRRLGPLHFEVPLLSASAKRGRAHGLARSSLPFLQPRIELGDNTPGARQGMLPLSLLRGLPFAATTVLPGRTVPCAREPSVNEAIVWGCPAELTRALAILTDEATPAADGTPSADAARAAAGGAVGAAVSAVSAVNRKQEAPGRFTQMAPLFVAIVAADESAVAALIAAGADVNLLTENGETPLAAAVWRGSRAITELLLNADARINFVTQHANGQRTQTALHSAAYESDAELAQLLIDRGANPTAQAESGWTPLSLALVAPHGTALVKAMLKTGADVNKPTPFANNATWGNQSANPLLIAISYNSHRTVRYLLSIGADPTLPGPWGFPVGHFAAYYGHLETLEALRESGVDLLRPIASDRPHAGETYLMHAVHGGKMHAVDYMLGLGANASQRDAKGKTAFDHAVDYRHVAIAAKLKLLH